MDIPDLSRRGLLRLGGALVAGSILRGRLPGAEIDAGPQSIGTGQTRSLRDGDVGRTADQGDGTFLNPILPGDYSDPAVLKDGEDYYLSHSMCGDLSPSILIWHSRDLVNWEPVCRALADGSSVPELVRYKDRFFIYYVANGPQDCMVITAPTMAGPWSDPVSIGYGDQIDPGYVLDRATGRHYLHFSQGWVVELSDDGLRMKGEPRKVYDGWPYPRDWPGEGSSLEAPKLFFRDGYYYLCVAQGGTAGPPTSHMVAAARSKSPLGPWENSPHNPVVHTYSANERWWSKGHGPVVEGPDGTWWIVYHAYENGYRPLGRQTLLQPLAWTDDGWFTVAPGSEADQIIRKPAGGQIVGGSLKLSDTFCSEKLGLQWAAIGTEAAGKYRATKDGLELIASSPSLGGVQEGSRHAIHSRGVLPATITLLALIPVHHDYEACVTVRREVGVEAGLLLYYCPESLAGIGISRQNEIMTMGSIYRRSEIPSKPAETLFLKVINRGFVVTLFWSTDGDLWTQSEYSHEISGYHHNDFGGYAGVRVALYADGNGRAIFRDFVYRGIEPV